MKSQKWNKGIGLVEALIASVIVAGIGVGVMKIKEQAVKTVVNVETDTEMTQVLAEVRAILSDSESCRLTLGGQNASNMPGGIVNKITYKPSAAAATDRYIAGADKRYGQGRLRIKDYRLSDASDDVDVSNNTTDFLVTFLRSKMAINEEATKRIKMWVEVNSAGNIVSCRALSATENNIWSRSSVTQNDIYYTGGNVGVGVGNPQSILHLNYDSSTILSSGPNPPQNILHVNNIASSGAILPVFFQNSPLMIGNGNQGDFNFVDNLLHLRSDQADGSKVLLDGVSLNFKEDFDGDNQAHIKICQVGTDCLGSDFTSAMEVLEIRGVENMEAGNGTEARSVVGLMDDVVIPNGGRLLLGVSSDTQIAGINIAQGGAAVANAHRSDSSPSTAKAALTIFEDEGGATDDAAPDLFFHDSWANIRSKGRMHIAAGNQADATLTGDNTGELVLNPWEGSGDVMVGFGDDSEHSLWVKTNFYVGYERDHVIANGARIAINGGGDFTGEVKGDKFIANSDRRLKTDIVEIEDALDSIKEIRGVLYYWSEEERYKRDPSQQLGVIAQEVQAKYPQIVSGKEGENSFLSVDYSRLTPILVEAVKELDQKLQSKTDKIESLNQQLAAEQDKRMEDQERIQQLEQQMQQMQSILADLAAKNKK